MIVIQKIVEFLKRKRLEEVNKYIDGRLLDIACGDNTLVKKYHKDGVGLDVFNYFNNVDLIVKDSGKIPLNNNSFETITIIAALNHIPKYKETLTESLRLLNNGGKIIITMPIGWPQKVWHKIAHDFDDDQVYRGINEDEERYSMPIKEIKEALQEVGFKNIKTKSFLFGINNLVIAEK